MSSVHNSVETVNAAATAIVTAESRVQPSTVQKRRWARSCLSIYSCFGTHKQTKKIGHAVIHSEPSVLGTVPSISENRTPSSNSSSITIPFIAPPSSPASFLPSDPPSANNSPGGLLSLSVHARCSQDGPASIFAIGPYAHETQLVSPPVFSTFTTEPSTASFTPPPEPVQMTTPSSPEVPFAQLLSSSLARNRSNSGSHAKFPLSQYEFQPYGSHEGLGSAVSTSGTSSPFPDRREMMEFRMGEAPKFLGYENYKWDSRAGSGSLTPNEWGSRLGSGAMTPLTPKVPESRVSENLDRKSGNDELINQRVSFELFGEDIPTCVVRAPSLRNGTGFLPAEIIADDPNKKEDSFREHFNGENGSENEFHQNHRTISLGSSKDFNFNNASKGEVMEKSSVDCEWWTNEEGVKKESSPRSSWSFFPMLQSG